MAWGEYWLSELKLDPENIRTGRQPTQRDSIQALIRDQKYKIVALADDLLKVGPSPGEPIWVTEDPSEPGKQIVLEGNRRVAALKMLETPQLADDTPYAKAFADMAKEFSKQPRRKLEARIFASRDEARPWIERRHMPETSGVGLQKWGSLAIHKERRESGAPVRRSLAALEYLDDGSREFAAVGSIIHEKATTVDRVLNHPDMRDVLGITIERKGGEVQFGNGDEAGGRQLLSDIITKIAAPDFTFSSVRDAPDRAKFLAEFADRSVAAPASAKQPDKDKGPDKAKPADADVSPPTAKDRRARPAHAARATLAPKSGNVLRVSGPRLNPLYDECRNIIVADHKNASALLLRVFLELCSETLLIKRAVPPSKGCCRPKKEGVGRCWCQIVVEDYCVL